MKAFIIKLIVSIVIIGGTVTTAVVIYNHSTNENSKTNNKNEVSSPTQETTEPIQDTRVIKELEVPIGRINDSDKIRYIDLKGNEPKEYFIDIYCNEEAFNKGYTECANGVNGIMYGLSHEFVTMYRLKVKVKTTEEDYQNYLNNKCYEAKSKKEECFWNGYQIFAEYKLSDLSPGTNKVPLKINYSPKCPNDGKDEHPQEECEFKFEVLPFETQPYLIIEAWDDSYDGGE